MKKKQRMKLKACSPERDKYHLIFNNVLLFDSDLLRTNTHKGCCMLNFNEYNYKLRSVIGREDKYDAKNWIWFNKQVHDTFTCSWMISWKLVDHQTLEEPLDVYLIWYMHRQQI